LKKGEHLGSTVSPTTKSLIDIKLQNTISLKSYVVGWQSQKCGRVSGITKLEA
jgi:hypothetical protein